VPPESVSEKEFDICRKYVKIWDMKLTEATPSTPCFEVSRYCGESDLHPHNGTYIDYDVSEGFPNSNSALDSYLYTVGVVESHQKVLIHFDY